MKKETFVDGLTPMQCYDAFCAAQRDQRTFTIRRETRHVVCGDVLVINGEQFTVQSLERVNNGHSYSITMCAAGIVLRPGQQVERVAPALLEFDVQRPVDLTPAQRERAREIWSRGVRYQVAVTDARAVAQAPSVVTVDQDLEVESLAKDAS